MVRRSSGARGVSAVRDQTHPKRGNGGKHNQEATRRFHSSSSTIQVSTRLEHRYLVSCTRVILSLLAPRHTTALPQQQCPERSGGNSSLSVSRSTRSPAPLPFDRGGGGDGRDTVRRRSAIEGRKLTHGIGDGACGKTCL